MAYGAAGDVRHAVVESTALIRAACAVPEATDTKHGGDSSVFLLAIRFRFWRLRRLVRRRRGRRRIRLWRIRRLTLWLLWRRWIHRRLLRLGRWQCLRPP